MRSHWITFKSRAVLSFCALKTDSVTEVTVEYKKKPRILRTGLRKVQILVNAGPVWAWIEYYTEVKGNLLVLSLNVVKVYDLKKNV